MTEKQDDITCVPINKKLHQPPHFSVTLKAIQKLHTQINSIIKPKVQRFYFV